MLVAVNRESYVYVNEILTLLLISIVNTMIYELLSDPNKIIKNHSVYTGEMFNQHIQATGKQ